MKQEFFPIVWTTDVTHQLRRYQIRTVCPSIARMHNNIFLEFLQNWDLVLLLPS